MSGATVPGELPAVRGGAKAMLLTVLGEFVLPAGGQVWTSTLVAAAEVLGIGEKNARQAIARIGDQALIEASREGRRVRWSLTPAGRKLLDEGTERIYAFGYGETPWRGEWLVAHCPVAETQRSLRNRLRAQLGFLGFGELSPSLLISPHVDREDQLRSVLDDLGLSADSVVLRSTTLSAGDDAGLVERAWDLGALEDSYRSFCSSYCDRRPSDGAEAFRDIVDLVHDWRAFPSVDPELPTELLPAQWAGSVAASTFHQLHRAWTDAAHDWFDDLDTVSGRPG